MSPIFLETLKLSLNLKPEWIDSLDNGLCSYSFCRTRRHFKNFKRGIHYICQNDDKQQARILPFSNFHLRIYGYIEANATYGKLWAYVMNLVPGFQNRLFSKSQTNQNKQSLILISFFSHCKLFSLPQNKTSLFKTPVTHSLRQLEVSRGNKNLDATSKLLAVN